MSTKKKAGYLREEERGEHESIEERFGVRGETPGEENQRSLLKKREKKEALQE